MKSTVLGFFSRKYRIYDAARMSQISMVPLRVSQKPIRAPSVLVPVLLRNTVEEKKKDRTLLELSENTPPV